MTTETKQHTLTGEFRTHERFRSRFLPHERTILVYLPPGYKARAARRYPVLYLQDGQNVFDKATSIGEEWHVDETAQALIERGEIEPLIVVAIYNTGEHRIDEYAPTKVPEKGGGGSADLYGRMLVEELKPQRAFFTHISHDLPHRETNKTLPEHVRLAHDGLKLEFEIA